MSIPLSEGCPEHNGRPARFDDRGWHRRLYVKLARMTTARIRNGDVELHIEQDGDPDAPPVLLLHGIASSGNTWDWLVATLTSTHSVLRLDFRGHGRSGRAPGAYQMPDYLTDAVAACEQVAKRPCVVVGHSLGGATAAALAQQRPDLVSGIVLEDPPLFVAEGLGENALMATFRLMRDAVPTLQEQKVPIDELVPLIAAIPSASGATLAEVIYPDAIEATAASLLLLDATVLDPVLEGRVVAAFDPEQPIPVRTLVLAADPASPDAVVRPADVERLARRSPDAEVRVISGAGHLIHNELAHREVVRNAIREFLDAQPA
jgi:pimeloyl-ACP methyl ester carboxylesterase